MITYNLKIGQSELEIVANDDREAIDKATRHLQRAYGVPPIQMTNSVWNPVLDEQGKSISSTSFYQSFLSSEPKFLAVLSRNSN
jgi:hypothetical protein